MAIETTDTASVIRAWLHEHVTGSLEVPDDYELIANGLLTSLQTVELVLFLEQRFGIEVTDDEFVEENFGTVGAITALVVRRTA